MRRHPEKSCILGICCLLLGLAAAGPAPAAGIGRAGQAIGFPTSNPRYGGTSTQNADIGVGLFSNVPFHITLTVRGGYDDNVTTSSVSPQGSGFINGTINLTYDFGSPRTQLSLQMGGGITDYFDRPQQKDPDYNAYLGLSLKHSFSPRLLLAVTTYAAYQAEPDFSIGTGFNRRVGNYFYTSDRFTLTYLWAPRFSTATSYTFGALLYDNTGSSGVGRFENRVENTFGNEFRFLLWPTTTVVAEYRIQFTTYLDSDSDALTHFILGGFDHSFSPRLNLSFRGGFQIRTLDTTETVPSIFPFLPPQTIHTSEQSTSPYFEATLTYVVGKQTSATWTSRYGIEEPDVAGQPARTTYRTGLEGRHYWTPRISSQLAVYYQHDHYGPSGQSAAFDEDAIDAALSLRYSITRYLGVEVGYNHIEVLSDVSLREYSRNRVYAGADFSF